jgi:uncharacterized protein YyaL (SSP411 family)
LPKTHPAYGKNPDGNHTAAYLCPGQSCLPPTNSADSLKDMIKAVRGGRHRPAANDG